MLPSSLRSPVIQYVASFSACTIFGRRFEPLGHLIARDWKVSMHNIYTGTVILKCLARTRPVSSYAAYGPPRLIVEIFSTRSVPARLLVRVLLRQCGFRMTRTGPTRKPYDITERYDTSTGSCVPVTKEYTENQVERPFAIIDHNITCRWLHMECSGATGLYGPQILRPGITLRWPMVGININRI